MTNIYWKNPDEEAWLDLVKSFTTKAVASLRTRPKRIASGKDSQSSSNLSKCGILGSNIKDSLWKVSPVQVWPGSTGSNGFRISLSHIRRKGLSKFFFLFKSPQRRTSACAALTIHGDRLIQAVWRTASTLTQRTSHPFPAVPVWV